MYLMTHSTQFVERDLTVLESTKYLLTVCMYIYIYIYMDLKNIFNDTLNTFWGAGPNSATKS